MRNVVTILAAAAGGFVLGVLLAPKSGSETRKDLLDKKDEYQEKAIESMQTIKKGAASIKDELVSGGTAIKGIAEDVGGDIAETANSVKKTALK
ncbi:MAG: YtxH domain-containing protein [Patescibacteria group bacterium]